MVLALPVPRRQLDNGSPDAEARVQAIVGREVELEAVERFLDGITVTPRALVIAGEAGIGKTTLWQEAVAAAQTRGLRVLKARPAEREAELSYAALADLVGAVYDDARPKLPLPQQRALDAALLRAEPETDADVRTVGTALVTILAGIAADGAAVVAIDDVQWLDAASTRALEFAARRLLAGVGLLLTHRTGESVQAPLGLDRAFPEEQRETIVLGPLSLAALHHLLRNNLRRAPARPTLVRIANACGGNPFFALEIARALERDAADRALADPLPVPERLNELVAARLRALSRPARDSVVMASALSRPTTATVAEALGADEAARVGLTEAEEAGLVVTERARIRFSHPLLASAVYASLPELRRRELHRRLADVVADDEERARHLARSATESDAEVAAELERVAELSARRGAQDAAAELHEEAARLTPVDRPDARARRVLGAGSALFAAGDVGGARALAESVVAAPAAATARVNAFVLLSAIASISGAPDEQTAYLELALVDAGDDRRLRGKLHALLSMPHMRPDQVVRHTEAALRLLDADEQPALVGHVLIQKFMADAMAGRGADRILLERGLELEANAPPRTPRSILPLTWYRGTDEFDAARARFKADEQWYREHGDEGWRAQRLAYLAEVELRAGNWDLAERQIEEACAVLEQVATRGPWSMPMRIRALIDAHRGRVQRARETLVPLVEEAERTSDLFWTVSSLSVLGFVHLTVGDHDAVDRTLTRMATNGAAFGVTDAPGDRSEPDHVETLVALGDVPRASAVVEHLEWRGRTWPRLWIDATLPRARALVLAAQGDPRAALAELDRRPAVEDLPFDLARTLLLRGTLHRRLKQKRSAADALRGALEIFEQLGSPPWAERARAELGRLGLRHAASGELTETERRVAELAASGHTNREVAQQLFMSPKTVEANLARVYRKLAIRSRAELGARMGERATKT